jgi:hypothetical protein
MHATFTCGNGIQASAKVDHFGERGRVRADVLLFAARPDRIRLDVVSPFGVALATLTSDGRRFALDDLREKRFLFGPASACNIARLTSVPIPGHVLVDLLRGEAPVLKHAATGATMTWSTSGYWKILVPGTNESVEEVHLAPRPDDWARPWQEQRMRVLEVSIEQRGFVLYQAELRDHAQAPWAGPREDPDGLGPPLAASGPPCDAEIPRKIHVEVTDPDSDVRFIYERTAWNPALPEGTFSQTAPAGMRVEPVTCE